ncbi:TRAP transporter substrate-binding protein [Actinoplanes sp. NPDC051513]|uniref:TRAP transporter substrate-binding protein n=1 Tax=Actinoplanes sp. NPDC051513 TaxID=3363908 RepID=UPI0037B2900B
MVAIAAAAAVLAVSGCTDKARSKAGGNSPPVTLRIGTNDEPGRPSSREIEEFARQVGTRSHGQIRVEPVWQAAGTDVATGWDQAVAHLVMKGDLDMGMIPTRTWDTENVTSLRALQAPFLVDSDGLAKQVVAADLAGEMLAGLDRAGVTGLALIPESTRHIFGYGKPLLSPADLHGVNIRVPLSNTSFALFRALGSTPTDLEGPEARLAGAESSFELVPHDATTATGNVTPYSKINSVVINSKRFAAFDQTQRELLRAAAIATRDWGMRSMPVTADEAKQFCQNGHTVVLAAPADLAAFRREAQPVYAELEKDSQTAALITAIRGLAARTEPAPPVAACSPPAAATASAQPAASVFPDGTYRKEASEQAMLAGGVNGRDAKDHAGLWTMTFDKGAFTIQQRGYPVGPGVYCIAGDTITVAEGRSRCGGTDGREIFVATWRLDKDQLWFTATVAGNGTTPGALMRTLFGGEPWTKID